MLRRHRDDILTGLLLAAIVAVTAITGHLVAGTIGVFFALGLVAASLFVEHRAATLALLRRYGARRVPLAAVPRLRVLLDALSRRAGIPVPAFFLVDLPVPQAMAMGSAEAPIVVVSQPLLDQLTARQIAAVLAHEISHLRHGDLHVLRLTDVALAVVAQLARLGLLLAIVAWVLGAPMSFAALTFLVLAPMGLVALRQALSRTREFAADAGAARLTGDPLALAQALEALERPRHWWWWLAPAPRAPEAQHWLASHPVTPERVRRLKALAAQIRPEPRTPPPTPPPSLRTSALRR